VPDPIHVPIVRSKGSVGAMKIAAEGEEMFAFGAVQTNIRTVSEQPKYSQSLALDY
jgi:hypothetical protein